MRRSSPKRQRLTLALAAVAALTGAGVLAVSTLGSTATYFYAPADVAKAPPAPGQVIRLGGLVKPGSVERRGERLAFTVTDNLRETRVSYTGIVPDLFRESQGVIATGSFAGGTFMAEQILAKHDENYMPPEVAGSLHKVEGTVG